MSNLPEQRRDTQLVHLLVHQSGIIDCFSNGAVNDVLVCLHNLQCEDQLGMVVDAVSSLFMYYKQICDGKSTTT